MSFNNSIAGGNGSLVRNQLQSPNFVSGASGWQITKLGNAEFNQGTFRGSLQIGSSPGAHILNDATTGTIQVYDSSNNLIATVAPASATIGGVNVSLGFQVFRAGQPLIYARMFDDQVEFHDTLTIPSSTPGSISNANQSGNSGTPFLRMFSGTANSKQSSQAFCVGATGDGTFSAYLGALQQIAGQGATLSGQLLQNDSLAAGVPWAYHSGLYTINTDASGNFNMAHGCGFTPLGATVTQRAGSPGFAGAPIHVVVGDNTFTSTNFQGQCWNGAVHFTSGSVNVFITFWGR